MTEKSGAETIAVTRIGAGSTVRKYKFTNMGDVAPVVNKLHDHNELFGGHTAYTFQGVAGNEWSGGRVEPIIIADQPYIEFVKGTNRIAIRRMFEDLKERYGMCEGPSLAVAVPRGRRRRPWQHPPALRATSLKGGNAHQRYGPLEGAVAVGD